MVAIIVDMTTAMAAEESSDMAQQQRRTTPGSRYALQFLLTAGGLLLISFGAVRLEAGTRGVWEAIPLVACIASGAALLVVAMIGAWKALAGRRR